MRGHGARGRQHRNCDLPEVRRARGAGAVRRARVRHEGTHRAARRREGLRRRHRRRPRGPRRGRRQLLLPARPVRMRQDLDPADGRGPRGDQRGKDPDRRARRRRSDAGPAPDGHDVPELRAVPAPELPRQRRVQPADAGHAEGRAPRRRAREARAGPHGRLPPADALAALRRTAAAGRARPRARHQPLGAPARRAALRPGPLSSGTHARGAAETAARPRDHIRPRHALAAGGDVGRGRGGGHGPRTHRAGRTAAPRSTTRPRPASSPRQVHRRSQRAGRNAWSRPMPTAFA